MTESADGDGQLHTLGLLERLRAECKTLWGTSSELYFRVDELLRELANPNLHDIPTNLPFRVECGTATISICAGSSRLRRACRSATPRSMWRSPTIRASVLPCATGRW